MSDVLEMKFTFVPEPGKNPDGPYSTSHELTLLNPETKISAVKKLIFCVVILFALLHNVDC